MEEEAVVGHVTLDPFKRWLRRKRFHISYSDIWEGSMCIAEPRNEPIRTDLEKRGNRTTAGFWQARQLHDRAVEALPGPAQLDLHGEHDNGHRFYGLLRPHPMDAGTESRKMAVPA
jgi:hypothetical protein